MRRIVLLFYIVLGVCAAYAQNITVAAPSNVSTGENFRIAYTVSTQNVDEFRAGNIPAGLEVIVTPRASAAFVNSY